MTFNTERTAKLLGTINDVEQKYAPDTLYTAGDTHLFQKGPRISIVGSRAASSAGLQQTSIIAETVINHGGVVVSGLAKGIDTAAHQAAIEIGGSTIAVLGTPLEDFYPRENKTLQERIMREHLAVSQFTRRVGRSAFPMRNRTMALVSHATLIVEAGEMSGTKHQGWEAIRLGRMVLLPEQLVSAPFAWPSKLLEYGALTYSSPEEVRELLKDFFPAFSAPLVLNEHSSDLSAPSL